MRTLSSALLIFVLAFLSGCDDKTAREYAKQLEVVLKSYHEQVDRKVEAEQATYKTLASAYARADELETLDTLRLERQEAAEQIVDDLVRREAKASPSELQKGLQLYGNKDFELTRKSLEQEADAKAQYLADLDSLDFESKNIDALTQVLEELSKPKGDVKRLQDLAAFVQQSKSKFDELACDDLAQRIACITGQITKLTAAMNAESDTAKKKILKGKIDDLQGQGEKLTAQTKTRSCDASKTKDAKCPETP